MQPAQTDIAEIDDAVKTTRDNYAKVLIAIARVLHFDIPTVAAGATEPIDSDDEVEMLINIWTRYSSDPMYASLIIVYNIFGADFGEADLDSIRISAPSMFEAMRSIAIYYSSLERHASGSGTLVGSFLL